MIVVVGLNHETAPVAVREAMAFPKDELGQALDRVREDAGLGEAMILSTCNRVEIYGRSEKSSLRAVADFLARYHRREPEEIQKHLYLLEGEAAVRHAFRVAASLDSMVLGEPQILGQVKDAYDAAEEAKSLGSVLNGLRSALDRGRQAGPQRDGDRQERRLAVARRRRARDARSSARCTAARCCSWARAR